MTAAEMRRILLVLQRERQKGFIAWQQLCRRSSSADAEGNDRSGTQIPSVQSAEPVPFPITARGKAH